MIFLIAEKIKFNPEDGSLTHCATKETVKLTLTASRLLETLLRASEGILSREKLLTMVWDDYGLQASNSSLNQYISILRRALSAFGCEELIITVPKMGFRLNPDITLQLTQTVPLSIPEQVTSQRTGKLFSLKNAYLTMIIVLTLFICGAIVFFNTVSSVSTSHYPLYKDSLATGCEVVYMKNLSERDREKARKNIAAILKDNAATCGPEQKVIFDSNDSFTAQSAGRTLFSLCTAGKNNQRGCTICVDCGCKYHC